MRPLSPAIPNMPERVYGENQPQYNPLPGCFTEDGRVITCWQLTWRERLQILAGGRLWLQMLTFNKPLQPVKLTTEQPDIPQ